MSSASLLQATPISTPAGAHSILSCLLTVEAHPGLQLQHATRTRNITCRQGQETSNGYVDTPKTGIGKRTRDWRLSSPQILGNKRKRLPGHTSNKGSPIPTHDGRRGRRTQSVPPCPSPSRTLFQQVDCDSRRVALPVFCTIRDWEWGTWGLGRLAAEAAGCGLHGGQRERTEGAARRMSLARLPVMSVCK